MEVPSDQLSTPSASELNYESVMDSVLQAAELEVDLEAELDNETEIDSDDTETNMDPSESRRLVLWKGSIGLFSSISSLAINLFLPFVNGMMLGFGEILAHELGFKWGWVGARVS